MNLNKHLFSIRCREAHTRIYTYGNKTVLTDALRIDYISFLQSKVRSPPYCCRVWIYQCVGIINQSINQSTS